MQVAQVKPGVNQQALEDMARHMGMQVGLQGGIQVLYSEHSHKTARDGAHLSVVSAPENREA